MPALLGASLGSSLDLKSKMSIWVIFTAISCWLIVAASAAKQPSELEPQRVIVHTTRGDVRGFHVQNALLKNMYRGEGDVFLGVPYTEPPVGERRFKKPQLIGNYDKLIEANKYGAICPQFEGEKHAGKYHTGMAEDCLTLNIFTPNATNNGAKYPVLVYIHGGGFKFGDVAEWMYHGIVSNIVRRQVIFVSFNYRVGMLGFFTTFTEEFPPNRGIWDQITALHWIHQEITNFGGDPSKVTLIGHSAGACSASSLAQSPAVDSSLFRGVILLSCAAEVCFDNVYGRFTQSLDRAEQTFRWNTVVDGELFTDVPSKMNWKKIPVLMGSTEDEYALYAEWALSAGKTKLSDYTAEFAAKTIRQWVTLIFGSEHAERVLELVQKEYPPPSKAAPNIEQTKYMNRVSQVSQVLGKLPEIRRTRRDLPADFQVLSDLIYIRAVGDEARMHLQQGNPNVWLWQIAFHTDYYSFYTYPDYKPVFHGMELFLLLQPDYAWTDGDQPKRWGKAEEMAADRIAQEFTDFTKYGKPSASWESLNIKQMNFWRFDGKDLVNNRTERFYASGYGGRGYAFWRRVAEAVRSGNLADFDDAAKHSEL
ncbi:unnamed protein product [Anisakis simplex]|uniref:Carboxylic ester hydrolase n=1 Tax=Anisakis simplex TaxID=6269 RepID=A0A0M3KBA2_ANISI|nr:unnamed protein product [Anisakis simplex]